MRPTARDATGALGWWAPSLRTNECGAPCLFQLSIPRDAHSEHNQRSLFVFLVTLLSTAPTAITTTPPATPSPTFSTTRSASPFVLPFSRSSRRTAQQQSVEVFLFRPRLLPFGRFFFLTFFPEFVFSRRCGCFECGASVSWRIPRAISFLLSLSSLLLLLLLFPRSSHERASPIFLANSFVVSLFPDHYYSSFFSPPHPFAGPLDPLADRARILFSNSRPLLVFHFVSTSSRRGILFVSFRAVAHWRSYTSTTPLTSVAISIRIRQNGTERDATRTTISADDRASGSVTTT